MNELTAFVLGSVAGVVITTAFVFWLLRKEFRNW